MAGIEGKTGSEFTEFDYTTIINCSSFDNFIDYNDVCLVDSGVSAEGKVIKKQCYEMLSEDAKEVIKIVTDRPLEFKLFMKGKGRKPCTHYPRLKEIKSCYMEKRMTNLNLIKGFFKWNNNWPKKYLNSLIKEIQEFCSVL